MKLIFIRHGETTGDVEDRYGGDYDDNLTAKGHEQAKKFSWRTMAEQTLSVYKGVL